MKKWNKVILSVTIITTLIITLGINTFASEVDDPIGRCRVAPYMETIK